MAELMDGNSLLCLDYKVRLHCSNSVWQQEGECQAPGLSGMAGEEQGKKVIKGRC